MSAIGHGLAERSVRLSLGDSDRARTVRGWGLRIAAVAVPTVVGVLFVHYLREGFDPVRLAAKSLLPFAALLPLAVFASAGPLRRAASAGLTLSVGWAAMVTCVAMFGMPLDPQILAGFFRAIRPELLVAALMAATVLGLAWSWMARRTVAPLEAGTNAVFAVTEGVYFGGFLLGSTGHMDAWVALPLIGGGQALVAGARGVPAWRALLGAVVLVAAASGVGNAYAAIARHLALLGSPTLAPRAAVPSSRQLAFA